KAHRVHNEVIERVAQGERPANGSGERDAESARRPATAVITPLAAKLLELDWSQAVQDCFLCDQPSVFPKCCEDPESAVPTGAQSDRSTDLMLPAQAHVIHTPAILPQIVGAVEAQRQVTAGPKRYIAKFKFRQGIGRIPGVGKRPEEQLLGL